MLILCDDAVVLSEQHGGYFSFVDDNDDERVHKPADGRRDDERP